METTNAPSTPPNTKRRRMLFMLGAIFLSAGLLYGSWWFVSGRYHESTDDAYVGGNLVQVMPRVAGTVVAVKVDVTDRVDAGQALVRLDDIDFRVALQNAKAVLAQAVRQVRQQFEVVKQYDASVAVRQAALAKAKEDLKRRLGLLDAHSISAEDVAHAQTVVTITQAKLRLEQARLAAAQAQVVGTSVRTHPTVLQAQAHLRDAYLALERCTVRAPVAGYIAKRAVQLGQQVTPGQTLMAVVPLNRLWVDANVKENQLANLRIGQPVSLETDSYGSAVTFHGHVIGLAPGTGAAFALLPPQNASGNWIKIVQRLPVRVSLDPKELAANPLRVGLSMVATIDTHNRSGSQLATARPDAPSRYITKIYADEDQHVTKLISCIVNANDPPPGARKTASGGC